MFTRIALFFSLLFASMASASMAQQDLSVSSRLTESLEDFQRRYGFPGATAAVVSPDGRITVAATGLADIEQGRVMTPDTPMLAASIGKSFVAATVLALENEGHLSRKDRLSSYLGDRPWFGALPNAESITIDQLLHHTAGLPDHVHLPDFQEAFAQFNSEENELIPEQLVGYVAGLDPLFEAGTGWAYSDTGYVLLGLVIEETTGKPWQSSVYERFLSPLKLTGTKPSDGPNLPGLAVGYTYPENPLGLPERTADADGRLLWNPAVEFAGGGFVSTSVDLARWGHVLFNGDAMGFPYLDRLLDGVQVDQSSRGILYGAGIAIYPQTPRGPVWGHGGWIPGYVSSLRHYPEHGVTVAFQINSDIGIVDDTSDLVTEIEAALADLAISLSR